MGFALNPLNRLSEKRHDDVFVARRLADPSTQFLLFDDQAPLLRAITRATSASPDASMSADRQKDARFAAAQCHALGLDLRDPGLSNLVYMGEDVGGISLFAVPLDGETVQRIKTQHAGVTDDPTADEKTDRVAAAESVESVDLRAIASRGRVSAEMLGILGCAKSVLHWHRHHRFCANCGSQTSVSGGGWRRDCANCSTQHFPRVDPVVIMLAVDGERCLLGRQPRFAAGMYSALAGFLEPGETVEEAVRREIHEEAGIACAEVRYFASQPWPFPSSLMLACFARASTTDIVIDATELEDARWFSRDEVASMLAGTHAAGLTAPQPFAIAHHLLRAFVEDGSGGVQNASVVTPTR